MSSMNQRFRKLVGSSRRSSNQSVNGNSLAATSSSTANTANSSSTNLARTAAVNSANSLPGTAAGVNGTASSAPNSVASTPSAQPAQPGVRSSSAQQQQSPPNAAPPALQANSSPPAMNNQPLGRPPSYQHANNLGAPQYQGQRVNSPMPPPPINTGGGHGYPPQGHAPQQPMYAQPPQYPMGQPAYGYGAPQPVNPHYARGQGLAEVEGSNRSKAQLIVGIDFVSNKGVAVLPGTNTTCTSTDLPCPSGNNIFRCCICFRDQHRGQRRYYR